MKLAIFILATVAFANGDSSHESAPLKNPPYVRPIIAIASPRAGFSSPLVSRRLIWTPAKLIEAIQYESCPWDCGPFDRRSTEYCIDVGGQILVGERAGLLWFAESDEASMRDLVGKQVTARFDSRSIWITDNAHRTIKIKRGSNFEQFRNIGCLVEVHKPKLAIAAKYERPRDVPGDAFPLAGANIVDQQYRPLFLWYSCSMDASVATIDCRKWYPKGDSGGVERYCTRTVDGAPVSHHFQIDHLASKEGQLVLTSGAILLFDHRGRVNDKLLHPGQACY